MRKFITCLVSICLFFWDAVNYIVYIETNKIQS